MKPIPLDRYAPGGDIYNTLQARYGTASADAIYAAAQTGDRLQLASAIASAKGDGPVLDGNTGAIFVNQLETDPLSAPLGAANNLIGNSVFSVLKNPYVVAGIAAGLFFFFGGADIIRRHFKKL
jgi:hypothetical protein